jgi:hypothetical protein
MWVPYETILFVYLQREWENGHKKIKKNRERDIGGQREQGNGYPLICLGHHTYVYTKVGQRFPKHISQVTEKLITPHIYKANDPSHIQSWWLLTLHSTTSNHWNAQCSQSVPHATIPLLFPAGVGRIPLNLYHPVLGQLGWAAPSRRIHMWQLYTFIYATHPLYDQY